MSKEDACTKMYTQSDDQEATPCMFETHELSARDVATHSVKGLQQPTLPAARTFRVVGYYE